MKNTFLSVLIFFAAIGLGLAAGSDPSGDKIADDVQGQPSVYASSLKEKAKIWIDTRLGKKTVKAHHLKVHQNGTRCDLCHDAQNPATPADDSSCLKCHGSTQQVSQLTAKLEKNPHDSPHYGTQAACTACHKEHGASVVACYECHLFKFENMK